MAKDVVLKVKTGRIFVELTMESTVKKLKKSARNIFLLVLILIKTKQITSERKEQFLIIKYGDADLPDELIGMTDQYSSFEDHVNIVRKDDF